MTRKVPPLRRRLAQAFALVAVAGFLALSAAVYTVVNVLALLREHRIRGMHAIALPPPHWL